MFTQGQAGRMEAALYLPSRITLWNQENLVATGCSEFSTSTTDSQAEIGVSIYPNPAQNFVKIQVDTPDSDLKIYNSNSILVNKHTISSSETNIDLSGFESGIYLFSITTKKINTIRKVIVL